MALHANAVVLGVLLCTLTYGAAAPVDCQVSAWGSCSACSVTCGTGGTRMCARRVITAAQDGGAACPSLFRTQACGQSLPACPKQDCLFRYDRCGACSGTCGTGTQTCQLRVLHTPSGGGAACPATKSRTVSCEHSFPCPTPCKVSAWAAWSACSASCGGGKRERRRTVTKASVNGGECVEWTREEQRCATLPCGNDCAVGSWGAWGACDATCGVGEQKRKRALKRANTHGGKPCPSLNDVRFCPGLSDCPVDCKMGAWGAFGTCSRTCGSSTRQRQRYVLQPPLYGGAPCPASHETVSCSLAPCSVHCEVSDWQRCSGCQVSCGVSPVEVCERSVLVQPQHGGAACPALTKTQPCPPAFRQPCPVDCVLSSWSGFSTCTRSCGGGVRVRSRSVVTLAANGGKFCDALENSAPCNNGLCAGDCRVGQWVCRECSATCGSGATRPCERDVISPPEEGGAACPVLSKTMPCNQLTPCPVDCEHTPYSAWGPCTKTCGAGGTQTRSRRVARRPRNGGAACQALTQSRACAHIHCPEDCQVSAWDCYACPQTCGLGQTTCVRVVTKLPKHGGAACPALKQKQQCSSYECPIDCSVGDWGAWSTCTRSCGVGSQKRTRTMTHAKNGGKSCTGQPVSTVRACSLHPCPVDCQVSGWGGCGECSNPNGTLFHKCGAGKRTCARSVLAPARHGGKACPALTAEQTCHHATPCPVDCVVEWVACSACTKTCGGGIKRCSRRITTHAAFGGKACSQELVADRPCNEAPCAVDCAMGPWGSWTQCSTSCGAGGVRSRSRGVQIAPAHGGASCPPAIEKGLSCAAVDTRPCPVDCALSAWHSCEPCPGSCGPRTQMCRRTVLGQPAHGGKACPASLAGHRPCSNGPCPGDCVVSDWAAWGACSKSCGDSGVRTRSRRIAKAATNGGQSCPPLEGFKSCHEGPCPEPCSVSDWGAWGVCSGTCGEGVKLRVRSVVSAAQHNGAACPALSETAPCVHGSPFALCPVDCAVGNWTCPPTMLTEQHPRRFDLLNSLRSRGVAASCSKTCGGGVFSIPCTRRVTTQPAHGGKACPKLQKLPACNSHPCKVDCQLSSWSTFTACTSTCGIGAQSRSRTVVVAPMHGGKSCPPLEEHHHCNTDPCPLDCLYTPWRLAGACTQSCGNGTQLLSRTIVRQQSFGGKVCSPPFHKRRPCNTHACPKDCKMSSWGEWSPCDRSCAGGQQARRRTMLHTAIHGGTCPHTHESRVCNNFKCPIDCLVTSWTAFSACSKTCNVGRKVRTRSVFRQAAHGGMACPVLNQTAPCETGVLCAVDCAVSSWSSWPKCSKSCGHGGVQSRVRNITRVALHGGANCPPLFEWRKCNTFACPQDCVMSVWKDTVCTKSCGGGTTRRTRKVLERPTHGGMVCPPTEQLAACNQHSCMSTVCHDHHVKCLLWGGPSNSRVRVLHARKMMKLQGHFTCRQVKLYDHAFSRLFATCKCYCDMHPGCCPYANVVLRNKAIVGNSYTAVPNEGACCQLCNNHPLCGSWEYSERGTCILKHGNPVYVANPHQSKLKTWAGAKGAANAHLEVCPERPGKVWTGKDLNDVDRYTSVTHALLQPSAT